MRLTTMLALALAAAALAACGDGDGDGGAPDSKPSPTATATTTPSATATPTARPSGPRTIATGLEVPWGIAFLPGGDALVGERDSGRIVRIPAKGGTPREVMRVPGVAATGEGGLLGLAVSPRYGKDRLVYAYFTTAEDNRIARFRLGGKLEPILTGLRAGAIHDGGRIAFGPDGKLYAGVGETGDSALSQDREQRNGKILRIDPDGGVPGDNPFPGSPVWSLGHRNVQGLAWDENGRLWATEFGQSTFDEVNLIRKGRNYGWPEVEGDGDTRGGRFTNPLVTWPTSEASPSGAAIVKGVLYIGGLQGQAVLRVRLDGDRATKLSPIFEGHGRIRTVIAAPDGSLWVTTSNTDGRGTPREGDDRIVALSP
jgi:glucose/arabinose dehydrogenase